MEKPGQSLKAARNSRQPKPRRALNRHRRRGLSLDSHQQSTDEMDATITSNLDANRTTTNTSIIDPDIPIGPTSNIVTPSATTPAITLAVPTIPAIIQPPSAFYRLDFAAAVAETSMAAKQQIRRLSTTWAEEMEKQPPTDRRDTASEVSNEDDSDYEEENTAQKNGTKPWKRQFQFLKSKRHWKCHDKGRIPGLCLVPMQRHEEPGQGQTLAL
uniref:Uncharacterized protein n=1 Tax=Romanomermis culicivorax TaxID=13658 RepID=A0A915JHU4_ROMCU